MSRISDRKHVFNLVFQLGFYEAGDVRRMLPLYFEHHGNGRDVDRAFVEREFDGVAEHLEEIDGHIGSAASGWDVPRLSKVDAAIMRLAVYEMMFESDIPRIVSMNEAVELAKEFSSDEAPAFVNGVLGKINKGLPQPDGI